MQKSVWFNSKIFVTGYKKRKNGYKKEKNQVFLFLIASLFVLIYICRAAMSRQLKYEDHEKNRQEFYDGAVIVCSGMPCSVM